jgi:hypothetical protein
MKITYQEWLKATYDFENTTTPADEIAVRMAKLADLGAEVVELERDERYLDGYKITALLEKYFPKTPPTPPVAPLHGDLK